MSCSELTLWWDKDADQIGRPIRPDVRASAHRVWALASRRAQSAISDNSLTAELMEGTVAQVSRYLDRHGVTAFSRGIDGLVMLAFQRALHRQVTKAKRFETVGGSRELSIRAVDRTWAHQIHVRLELDQVVRRLCEKSRTILALRYAGYTWEESARLLGVSTPGLRSAFWRDVAQAKNALKNGHSTQPEGQAQRDTATNNDPRC